MLSISWLTLGWASRKPITAATGLQNCGINTPKALPLRTGHKKTQPDGYVRTNDHHTASIDCSSGRVGPVFKKSGNGILGASGR
jgi:hypothetical protein